MSASSGAVRQEARLGEVKEGAQLLLALATGFTEAVASSRTGRAVDADVAEPVRAVSGVDIQGELGDDQIR